jgi:PAS domain-containing protein
LQTGVVLEDENRKVVLVNKTFCTMFDLGKDSEMLIGTDEITQAICSKSLLNILVLLLKDQDYFKAQAAVYQEELADGRILERSYIPFSGGI